MLYAIGDFELDTTSFELRRQGTVQHVEPLVFDLIRFLSENPGRILSRDEVIDGVWQGRIVSDATISSCVKSARRALGDSGENQNFIQTVRGRGFRFVGMVSRVGGDEPAPPAAVAATPAAAPARFEPTLLVLPFDVYSGDPQIEQTANVLAENLTTVLTRVPLLAIISRAAAFALKGQPILPRAVRENLGATYMIEGSLQATPDGLLANVQLIETARGTHLWAQQFTQPRGAEEADGLLRQVLPLLEPQLLRAMQADLVGLGGEWTGRQLLLRAISSLALKGWHTNSFSEARELLDRSVGLEPGFALAHAYLSLIIGLGTRVGLLSGTPEDHALTIEIADRALALDDMDSTVLGVAGCAIADVGQPERAIPILHKAIVLNQNNAQAHSALGSAYMLAGNNEDGIRYLSRGIAISPMDNSRAVWGALLACCHMKAGDADAAFATAEAAIRSDQRNYMPRVVLAGLHMAKGDRDGAARALAECYRVKPDLCEREIAGMIGPERAAELLAAGGAA